MSPADPATLDDLLTALRDIHAALASPPPELLDRHALASLLGIGVSTLDTHRAAGRVGPAPVRLGGAILWRRDEVGAWLRTPTPSGELHDSHTWPHVWATAQKNAKR